MSSSKLDKRPAQQVDPHDEPSADWGWHGGFPVGVQVWGWFVAIACLCMFIGNQVGHIEDIYLGLTGVTVIILLLISQWRRRTSWRR